MSAQFFFLLLNPAISTLLGAALLTIWLHKRDATFMRTAAIALFCFALAFVAQDILPPAPYKLSSIFINLAFLTTFTLFCIAMVEMSGGKPPLRSFLAIAGLTMLSVLFWLYEADSLANRVHTMNISHSIMALLTAIASWRSPRKGWGRTLAILAPSLAVANFVWRPLLVIWEGNFYLEGEAFLNSVYWNTTRLGSPIIAVCAALALMVGLSMALIKDLKLEARTDKLSGCLNRRGFEEMSIEVLNGPDRGHRPISLIIADLDHFKQVNDTLGHAMGDLVIQAFGRALRDSMPANAVVGRIGGEEFAVLLSGEGTWDANAAIARCQARFTTLQRAFGAAPNTASFGIYKCGYQDDLHKVLMQADKALYEAKSRGRNSVHTHNAPLASVSSL